MDEGALFLSRIQFAFVVAFHFLLPAFTIGLASYIAVLEGLYLTTGRAVYLRISTYWIKIFAVSFGMGVVSGIVMPFQFGTNWSRYSHMTADIVAPLMAYEGLTAFFLEAGFLGVLLFGRKLVPQWAHFFAAIMVAVGTLMSTFWILVVNSWMQTPTGFSMQAGRFFPDDWVAVIFNPSFPYRFAHTVTAVYLTTAFTVIGVAAYHVRHRRFIEECRVMIVMGVALATVLVPLQAVIGDAHGINTLEHQPAKLAAIEGIWATQRGVPAVLFAWPDEKKEANDAEIAIPKLASLYLTHSWDGEVRGLKSFDVKDRPPVAPVFFAFRVMVGMWGIMLLITISSWVAFLEEADRRVELVPAPVHMVDPGRLRRRHGRMGDDGGRPPAVGRVQPAPHRGRGHAESRHPRRRRVARALRRRVRLRVRRGRLLPREARARGTGGDVGAAGTRSRAAARASIVRRGLGT